MESYFTSRLSFRSYVSAKLDEAGYGQNFITDDEASRRMEAARRAASDASMPSPTKELARTGTTAAVFDTTDPKVVIRVGPDVGCDKVLARPEIQATGGVVRVHKTLEDGQYQMSWKEKVDTNWEGTGHDVEMDIAELQEKAATVPALRRIRAYGPVMPLSMFMPMVLSMAMAHAMPREEIAAFLRGSGHRSLLKLADAIDAGVPVDDLVAENLGVNGAGDVVVIDC